MSSTRLGDREELDSLLAADLTSASRKIVVVSLGRASSSRRARRLVAGIRLHGPVWLLEITVLNSAFFFAFLARYGGHFPGTYRQTLPLAAALITVSYSIANLVFHSYRSVWRFASVRDMLSLALTVFAATGAVAALEVTVLRRDRPIPLSVLAIGSMLGYLAISHIKFVPKLQRALSRGRAGRPVVIVGAGAAGTTLAHQLNNEPGPLRPVAFIDDDKKKTGRRIGGLPVAGTRDDLPRVLKRFRAEVVAIAIPSAPPSVIRSLVQAAAEGGARVHVVPSLHDAVATGRGLVLREVSLEDLFQRSEVSVDTQAIRARFAGKRVLVTGAAGSIGSEIVRQLVPLHPASIVLLDNNETGLTDLRDGLPNEAPYRIRLADIGDSGRIREVFGECRPEIVVHAAAVKHVDVLEDHPREALRVNVLGMWNCARAAQSIGSELFVLISSDKAVDAVSVLGASKGLGEQMITSLSSSQTVFAAVRFGNVLGSRGSVIPRFERQIAMGGPLTVTHPDVRRYFMSISEAVRLVLQSAAFAKSGYIYALDMGEEVHILSVAKRLAQLRGLRVPEDISITFTGLRAGERLSERLIGESEKSVATPHAKIRAIVGMESIAPAEWEVRLADLMNGNYRDANVLRRRLLELARDGSQPAPALR